MAPRKPKNHCRDDVSGVPGIHIVIIIILCRTQKYRIDLNARRNPKFNNLLCRRGRVGGLYDAIYTYNIH